MFVPEPLRGLAADLPRDAAAVVSEAERAIAALNAREHPELTPLARLLMRSEAIASSKVEGLQVAPRALVRAEAGGLQSPGAQTQDVLGNVKAMMFAIDEAAASPALGTDDLLGIHRVLLEASSNPHIAGRFRKQQNWIGGNDYNPCGADFVPPPPEHVEPLLLDLCEFSNDDSLPPLVQAAIAHAQFETIHPFEDGNGRTGRALVHVILRKRGLAPAFVPPISVVLAQHKGRYVDGLTAYRDDRVPEWIEMFCTDAARAASLATDYVERVRDVQREWRERLTERVAPRKDSAVWPLTSVLPGHPVLDATKAAQLVGRTVVAARAALATLETAGIVTRRTASKRNQVFEAPEILDLMESLDAGLPPP